MSKIKIAISKGKVTQNNQLAKDIITSAPDGEYIFSLKPVNDLTTPRKCQNAYFDKIDICVLHSGYTRYEIHDLFKENSVYKTTKGLDVEQWQDLLMDFSIWAFSEFDCVT